MTDEQTKAVKALRDACVAIASKNETSHKRCVLQRNDY